MISEVKNIRSAFAGLFSWGLFFSFFFIGSTFLVSCNQNYKRDVKITGKTMGTTYTVKYISNAENQVEKEQIDKVLIAVNKSMSTYDPNSTISRINEDTVSWHALTFNDFMFKDNFELSVKMFNATNGYFNPAIGPLVEYWGFGPERKKPQSIDQKQIDLLKQRCDFKSISLVNLENNSFMIKKQHPQSKLDFNAIAKGYGVDKVAQLLEKNNIERYMVEIGGEVRLKGLNAAEVPWAIAVSKPEKKSNQIELKGILNNKNTSIATSGNYQNYLKIGDKDYGHIINPNTGMSEQTDLLSATVLHENCAVADATATACMVMGFDACKSMIEKSPNLEAYLIYKDSEGTNKYYKTAGVSIR